jgi:large subunit ribosomal protein L13
MQAQWLTLNLYNMKYTFDATGKSLGRVASAAAKILIGKESTTEYARNKVISVQVEIINASKAKFTEKKLRDTLHERYSGYPGGLKQLSAALVASKKGYSELFNLAVYGMLPGNRLRKERMKNLKVTE